MKRCKNRGNHRQIQESNKIVGDSLSLLCSFFHYCLVNALLSSPPSLLHLFSATLGLLFSGKKTQEMTKNYLAPFTFLSTESDGTHRLRSYLQSSNPSLVQEAPSCSWSTISSSGFTHISVASSRSKPHHRLWFVAKWNFFWKVWDKSVGKGRRAEGEKGQPCYWTVGICGSLLSVFSPGNAKISAGEGISFLIGVK